MSGRRRRSTSMGSRAAREIAPLVLLTFAAGARAKILTDPNSRFSIVPEGTMKYAEFRSRVGTIKAKPASWKALFFPLPHALPGS